MNLKHIGFALGAALAGHSAYSAPTISDVNTQVLSEYAESTFYQPDLNEIRYYLIGDKAVIEGDIVVGTHEHVQMYGVQDLRVAPAPTNDGDGMTANAAWSGNTTWPNSTVPYVISGASQGDQNAIFAGMALISNSTDVQFVQRTNQADYIEVIKSDGCWSHVGRRGGRQELSIGNGCAYARTVAHEFMHAIGFFHEQSRSDRDNYVQINWQNIPTERQHNFDKHGAVTSSIGSYDPYSIMHYGYTAFSSNGQPTIVSLIPGVPSSALGSSNVPTSQDIAAVQAIYGNTTPPPSANGPLKVYQHCPWNGSEVGIQPGSHMLNNLLPMGFQDNQMSSFRLAPGFAVRFYQGANHDGSSHFATASDDCLANNGFNDNISSIYLRADGDTGLSGNYYLKNRNSALYMDVVQSGLSDGTNIRQWTYNGSTAQQFNFSHLGSGAYAVRNVNSNKAVDISGVSHNNGANVHQWGYVGGLNQQFVLRKVPGTNYYQMIAMHSGKSIKIAGDSTSSGANIEQWQNDNQASSHWELVPVGGSTPNVNILKEAESWTAMAGVQTEATQDPSGGNLNVGWIDANDWMAYGNITIPTAGSYTVEYRVASPSGGQLSLDINAGAQILGTRTIPATGGWQTWTTVSHTVTIPAGTHSFGIFASTGGWNINWFRITSN